MQQAVNVCDFDARGEVQLAEGEEEEEEKKKENE